MEKITEKLLSVLWVILFILLVLFFGNGIINLLGCLGSPFLIRKVNF